MFPNEGGQKHLVSGVAKRKMVTGQRVTKSRV